MPTHSNKSDWNPNQYLRFADHRMRPALELLDRIPAKEPQLVYDLGCGTGNITGLLAQRWPAAEVIGIDNSAQMLDKAKDASSGILWQQVEIQNWSPKAPPDIIYSNAALHWVEGHGNLFPALVDFLAPGGYLAVQMPLSWGQPSHRLMRETLANGGPDGSTLGTPALRKSVGRKWVEDTEVYFSLLSTFASSLDIWETEYLQILSGEDPVLEWVRGTGLRPILQGLPEDELRTFLTSYRRRLNEAYPRQNEGHTLFPFRRLFIVAQKLGGE